MAARYPLIAGSLVAVGGFGYWALGKSKPESWISDTWGRLRDFLFPPGDYWTFGVISDVQYANIDDGASFHGVPRYYRNSLKSLTDCVDDWVANLSDEPLAFVAHLGDLVDGKCPREKSEQALKSVMVQFSRVPCPKIHVIGNHCLYNFSRNYLNTVLGMPGLEGTSYYDYRPPHRGWRVVLVDSYDVSLLGWPEAHPNTELAKVVLDVNNPNSDKNMPAGPQGDLQRRFVGFGGGVGQKQLSWLRRTLAKASNRGERVIIFSHCALHPGTCAPACLMWNYEEVLEVVRSAGCVVATFAGHTHEDGYVRDEWGIHHRCVVAPLETPPGTAAHGKVRVYADRLEVVGVGAMESSVYPL